jgi:peptidoglycan hydrolase-like protein with peptidoglycan-binding domain
MQTGYGHYDRELELDLEGEEFGEYEGYSEFEDEAEFLELEAGSCRGADIAASDYIRWVQRSLNRNVGSKLPVTGEVTDAYRQAVRQFQSQPQNKLDPTGDVDESTQNALIKANESDRNYMLWAQRALNTTGADLAPGGIKGSKTIVAIRAFQSARTPDLCVDGYVGAKTELRLIQESTLVPPGQVDPPNRPKPDPTIDPNDPERAPQVCVQKCLFEQKQQIGKSWQDALTGVNAAVRRFTQLDAMPIGDRSKAWNNGEERTWFGVYEDATRKTPFAYVKRQLERMQRVLAKPDCDNLVFTCSTGRECRRSLALSGPHPPFHHLNPYEYRMGPRPYCIELCASWFEESDGRARTGAIVHEAAHYAGANRLLWEVYRERKAKNIAIRNAWGARVNAGNYEFYAMSFLHPAGQKR